MSSQKIKILVTGLCLSYNRGGPALILSFIKLMKLFFNNVDFIFSVPFKHYNSEQHWAKYYNIKIVCEENLRMCINNFNFLNLKNKESITRIHSNYIDAFKETDVVININGIAFVGDGGQHWTASLDQCLHSIIAKIHKKPFLRFIQSYGPFTDLRVKLLAKYEFSKLPFLMVRGNTSSAYCKKLLKNIPVYSFPDIAIILPKADETWSTKYLNDNSLTKNNYIILSPSTVIYSIKQKDNSSLGENHIDLFANIAKHFIAKNENILFLPHTTSSLTETCDRQICHKVIEKLKKQNIETSSCLIIEDELDCNQLKSIISYSKLAFVSRYHALVAALSSATPVVAIGWNEKYQDLFDFYELNDFNIDARTNEPGIASLKAIEKSKEYNKNIINNMKIRQEYLENLILKAGKLCADFITSSINYSKEQ